jgi:hypothetical protein
VLVNLSRTLVLLAAVAAPAAVSASEPASQQRADDRDQRLRGPRDGAPELICRSVEIAETREMPMVCMSAAEWRRAADQ